MCDIDEDALLDSRVTVKDFVTSIAKALSELEAPDPSWRVVQTWRDAEWFMGAARLPEEGPGPWAELREHNISSEATPHEMKVWGRFGSRYFEPKAVVMFAMVANEVWRQLTDEQRVRFGKIDDELRRYRSIIMEAMESGQVPGALYSDIEDIDGGGASPERLRKMRFQMRAWLLGTLRTVILCRFWTPGVEDLPNRKFSKALLSGWIRVGYVGSLRNGQLVVFHPAVKSSGGGPQAPAQPRSTKATDAVAALASCRTSKEVHEFITESGADGRDFRLALIRCRLAPLGDILRFFWWLNPGENDLMMDRSTEEAGLQLELIQRVEIGFYPKAGVEWSYFSEPPSEDQIAAVLDGLQGLAPRCMLGTEFN